jgi:hypothetical protein
MRFSEEAYQELIERVRVLDAEAAEYLETKARSSDSHVLTNMLSGSFIWDRTPQGHAYWDAIDEKLHG